LGDVEGFVEISFGDDGINLGHPERNQEEAEGHDIAGS
jgi:hypothetical protein